MRTPVLVFLLLLLFVAIRPSTHVEEPGWRLRLGRQRQDPPRQQIDEVRLLDEDDVASLLLLLVVGIIVVVTLAI